MVTYKHETKTRDGATKVRKGRISIAIFFVLGIAGSFFFSRSLEENALLAWSARAEADAQRLTNTFMLLLDHSNSPLQSLATLFNGSGRVAADEFENTIAYLKGHRAGKFPESMGFVTKSQPASCPDREGCWMVAYSTDESGVLRPGSDVSRFGPMATTIDTAVANANTLIIGPVFQRESGNQYSYYAVTIRNTRQFGIVLSLIDYLSLVQRMYDEWIPAGLRLRVEASFLSGDSMTEPRFIIGGSNPAEGTVDTINVEIEIDTAQFKMIWDVLPSYGGGPNTGLVNYALFIGILVALILVLLMRGRQAT